MTPDYLKVEKRSGDLIHDLSLSEARKLKEILTAHHKQVTGEILIMDLHHVAALQGAARELETLIKQLSDHIG